MQNEDLSVNDSNIMDHDATDSIYNNSTASAAHAIASPLDESLIEIESSFSDVNDEEVEVENDTDDDDDDDDIDEFIFSCDMNNQTKLFSSSPLSIRESCLVIIKLARRLNLNKNDIKNLLDGIRHLFPTDVKLPRTVKGLMKVIGFDCSKQVDYYCCQCLSHLNTPEQLTCTDGCLFNDKRRPFMNVIELATNNVKDEIFSTAKRYINLINEYYIRSKDILPCDALNGSIYERLGNTNQRQLTIMLHTDGAPVTKIGGKSLWPVQATILEIPPPVRDHISAVMVFAAWLGGSHPSRELLWNSIVEQIHNLYNDGIIIKLHDNTKIKFNIRIQLITFDLPALALNCNIVQFNGYDACPFCKIHGYAIGTQIFYAYSQTPSSHKTDHDYIQLSMLNRPRFSSSGIKGPTPLTKIMLFPSQIAVDYMHLVCSGHFKTLITYWNHLLLPHVLDQASNFLQSITLPHSFGYQFMPLTQYTNWKTKMFRDFLLYASPIFVITFLPDTLALHFLHYFIYIRVLHFYQHKDELHDIDRFFDFYYEHLAEHYGPKSELCTVHIHTHLLSQVNRHGSLSMTSCFPRESYIGHAIKWCQGKKFILEQFITWYKIDRTLYPDNTLNIAYLTQHEHFDENYLDKAIVRSLNDTFLKCCEKKHIKFDGSMPVKRYARYFRGLKKFHSISYVRGGYPISYWVSIKSDSCPQNHGICFGEVIYYFQTDNEYYAFIKHYKCLDKSLANGLLSTPVPQNLLDRLNMYYHFFHDKKFSYKIVSTCWITNIRMDTLTQRPARTTAGKTSKYADFSVVSFPQLKKHSIVKASLINFDPLSPFGVQAGNIKAYGERKKLLVIKTGSHQEMEEISSRFSKESGSEEIFIPEHECEYHPQDLREQTMDDDLNFDDDLYTPTTNRRKKPITTNEQKLTTKTTTGFDKDDDDFNRIFCSTPRLKVTNVGKRKKTEDVDSSSLSASSDSDQENRWSKNKENLIRKNIDLENLKNKKTHKKKQRSDMMIVQQSSDDYKSIVAEVDLLKKRVLKLEKVYGVIRKNTSFDQTKRPSTSSSQPDVAQDTISKVKEIFGVDPTTLRAPINRPTKVIRELYKNSGFELFKWKDFIEPNELLLKEFIQQKCLITAEDMPHTWHTITNSLAQMPYDAVKYKTKTTTNIEPTTPVILLSMNDEKQEN
ncbi:unnamed protein product [Rotaria socialis]|uniref:Transposase domain-containing protein n=1 Tax=Rotaria socialis TaxID=392032 RepID=A0A820VQH6_9BILA|nr:unnamed protein product [Rotaria socialis]CAF4709807.1 unnamed protein product [Rotaria socialis]